MQNEHVMCGKIQFHIKGNLLCYTIRSNRVNHTCYRPMHLLKIGIRLPSKIIYPTSVMGLTPKLQMKNNIKVSDVCVYIPLIFRRKRYQK